jgi:hypothetical protein
MDPAEFGRMAMEQAAKSSRRMEAIVARAVRQSETAAAAFGRMAQEEAGAQMAAALRELSQEPPAGS